MSIPSSACIADCICCCGFLTSLFPVIQGLLTPVIIVITVILIALSMAAIILVWAFINNMIKKQIKSSESCFGNYDKVQLNEQYTCYEKLIGSNYDLRFSLSVGDIEVDKVIVSVSSASAVKSYELTNTEQTILGLSMYPSDSVQIKLPGKNAGLTYKATGFTEKIDSIQIAPVIGKTQCDVSDSFLEIEDCALMS